MGNDQVPISLAECSLLLIASASCVGRSLRTEGNIRSCSIYDSFCSVFRDLHSKWRDERKSSGVLLDFVPFEAAVLLPFTNNLNHTKRGKVFR